MVQEGNVKNCPMTKQEWEARAEAKSGDCGGQSVYHCLTDNEGRKWERCVEKSLVKEGNCPIFTSKGFVDWKPCNMSIPTCPNSSYFSNDVYKYSICFGNNSRHEVVERISYSLIIAVVLGILFILATVSVVVFICMRRKRSSSNSTIADPDTQDEPLELQKLIPDGVSKEIVKKNTVISAVILLSNQEVRSIVVVGKFGNSVFSTSSLILETFKDHKTWKSRECRYTNIPNAVEEKTILYVYGWFGMWNDNLCSLGNVKTACRNLIRILNEKSNVKIIVGMRSDLYKKYHQALVETDEDQNTSLFHHEIYLDTVDARKDAEYINYFEKNIRKRCEDNVCVCKRLTYDMLQQGKDNVVGMPIKLNVIQRYHELIHCYLDEWDILKVMRDHFKSIEKGEKRNVYEWIMYICLKGKFCRCDEFDTNLVKEMSFEIKQSSFDVEDKELLRYIRMKHSDKRSNVLPKNAQYVFWHPFIYICAFHFLFHKDPEFVIKYCNVDAVLELVRPMGFKTSYFEVTANDRCVILFKERIRELGKEGEYEHHPLVQKDIETKEAEP